VGYTQGSEEMSEKKSKIKSIMTANVYMKQFYTLRELKLKRLGKLSYSSSNLIISYLAAKDMIMTTIEVSQNIPHEDLRDVIEIKAYEELGLDQAKEYLIRYDEGNRSGDLRVFNVFIAELSILAERFKEIATEIKYIDFIVPAPLLYRQLYRKDILNSNGVHCFVYFGLNDASITFYKNGKLIYSKAIEYSLEQIYEKYSEQYEVKISQDEFFKILETEGLKTIHADYQQNLMKFFGEIFISISDIIIYVKRAFELLIIDQMFIGSAIGPIVGLDEYSENYLGLHSSELNFNYPVKSDEWYVDQFQYMMVLAAEEYDEQRVESVNLTIYERPPPFKKRPSGQFIITAVAATLIGLSYPLYFLIGTYINDIKNFALENKETELIAESNKYKAILAEKKGVLNELEKKHLDLSTIYSGKEKTLTSIYDKKVNYRLKSGILYTLANEIKQFDVKVSEIKSDKNLFALSLVGKDEKKITELIKYISDKHFKEIRSIDIETITKNPEGGYYNGILKVDLQ